jgi:pantoate--beta-alanine ligase
MGALHPGHLSLIDIARTHAECVIVSIFVNPAQFAPHEDFDAYPRQEKSDLALLESKGVDIVYLPTAEQIYPSGVDQIFSVGSIGTILEGKPRPHFFAGVGQVVLKLLEQTQADVAVFGEKDFQQLTIIKQLIRQYSVSTTIIGAPVLREKDGLAMSSRNVYLSTSERKIAPLFFSVLCSIKDSLLNGGDLQFLLKQAEVTLLNAGFDSIDYIEVCDARTLEQWKGDVNHPARILGAVRLGTTRLIDNIPLL